MVVFGPSVVKFVGLGFLCGLIGSWLLTSSTSSYLGQIQLHPLIRAPKEGVLDVQHFSEHGGHHEGETLLVDELAKVRPVFAFIFTSATENETRAAHIKSTWAQRFDGYLFFSDNNDTNLPAFALPNKKGWAFTRSAIAHIYDNFRQNFTFFMKAHDTNYVVVENLRALLREIDFKEPLLIGRSMAATQGTIQFLSDESGYVMSRAALERLAVGIKTNVEACSESDAAADVNFGKCAIAVGVKLIHAVDQDKSDLFHPLTPWDILKKFLETINPDPTVFGSDQMTKALTCCSDQSVAFSDLRGAHLYMMEYMVYHLYPYGIIHEPENYEKLFMCERIENGITTGLGSPTLADYLARRVRVFAIILTTPPVRMIKAIHVKMTWARRFNGYMFVSSEEDIYLPSIKAVDKEGRNVLWEKIRQAMLYIYRNNLNDYDFFMKADDDTYVIVENLRFLLSNQDPDIPILMGRRFNVGIPISLL
ncbi:Glycoprotein-N-acetylgalactosamine 3-beta-galactosyltransferase [Echinococcus granulosus]|uniref:N-acetylgalactosaminide beta-1,3-galactosyltransferase n=1 Tax=Echinococcus granulosus TaxID=6210 RepID=W6UFD8_ECHGR|nr:Glycoprotein-N-acetylgalactosamine 3-beta-galactosyltransferase [Echinococcus granulosus]EUB60140.1 Glycoprotein-N-acetylgalactosamine 3-beta-galactosyltransferase [Echinococcus granulosus]